MKFCKNLQRIIDISDPEWVPYWTNYRMLKKLIKELPSFVPAEEAAKSTTAATPVGAGASHSSAPSPSRAVAASTGVAAELPSSLLRGDNEATATALEDTVCCCKSAASDDSSVTASAASHHDATILLEQRKEELGKSKGEIAFFKLLHAEFKKATRFFEQAQQEVGIRETRVREGMEIMKQPIAFMVNEKWSMMAKSIFRLNRDLLALQNYALMTYFAFSKILKKHDKVTGHQTRNAFMMNVVNNANFTHHPKLSQMITRCERLYEEVSERLVQEGKDGLYEDERLFINMISRLNEQFLDSSAGEPGAPGRVEGQRRQVQTTEVDATRSGKESHAVATLRSIVRENDMLNAANVSEGLAGDETVDVNSNQKRPSVDRKPPPSTEPPTKQQRTAL